MNLNSIPYYLNIEVLSDPVATQMIKHSYWCFKICIYDLICIADDYFMWSGFVIALNSFFIISIVDAI